MEYWITNFIKFHFLKRKQFDTLKILSRLNSL